jgi:hypothetical protein
MQPAYREASLRATHRGVERPVAATSSFSKDFHTFPRKFQAFPRKFQAFPRKFQAFPNFSKDFQTFFLGRFEENQGVIARSGRNRVFSKFLRRLGRDERPRAAPCRTGSRFTIARIPIIGKKLSAAISARGLRPSAASPAPTRKPTAAAPAPRSFGGRRRLSSWRPRFLRNFLAQPLQALGRIVPT